MNKKTWIKVKRGLLEAKHREALGVRVWLFMYMIDQADWETGMILKWRDRQAAKDLEMSARTVTTQRQEIETSGYITCLQGLHHQKITIHNWTNPREYSGAVLNEKDNHGTQNRVPSDGHGTRNDVPYGPRKPRTIYLNPHLKDSQWDVPPALVSIDFEDAFFDFMLHRKQMRKPLTQLAGERILARLAKYPINVAVAMLCQSIENGWQGVFELKNGNGNGAHQPTIQTLEEQGYVITKH